MLKMKKHKHIDKSQNVTILFGYSLFAFTLLAIIISTVIPFSSILSSPTAKHLNVVIVMIGLVAGTLVPPLISYILGDRATKTKSKVSHHFNGVLFGILAYWLSLLLTLLGSDSVLKIRESFTEPLATIIVGWPILAITFVMAILAISYASRNVKVSVLHYKPYQFILLATVIGTFLYILINQNQWDIFGTLATLIPIVLIGISYRILPKISTPKLTLASNAIIAASMGVIAASLVGQLGFAISAELILLTELIVWMVYMWLILRENQP